MEHDDNECDDDVLMQVSLEHHNKALLQNMSNSELPTCLLMLTPTGSGSTSQTMTTNEQSMAQNQINQRYFNHL